MGHNLQNWVVMQFDPLNPPVEPKAGKFGVAAVVVFGVLSIIVCFGAAYLWTDGDEQLAGAIGMASIIIPVTVGYFVSELRHQRAGAFWFVITAAVLAGSLAAWSYEERDDFELRRDLIAPGLSETQATEDGA